jgi:hypothetical protein
MRCDNSLCGSEMVRAGTHWRCLVCGNAIQADAPVHSFPTGAVRGSAGSTRYDLVPRVGLRRLAETCREGAEKYGVDNWVKGIPSSNLMAHALEHVYRWLDGDRTEDHLAHAAWGLFVLMHNEERRPELQDIGTQGGQAKMVSCPIKAEGVIEGTIHFEGPEDREEIEELVKEWVSETAASVPEGKASLPPYDQAFQEGLEEEMSRMASQMVANPHGPANVEPYPVPTENRPPPDRTYIQPRAYPTSPADAGYDEWKVMCARVDASRFRPWWEERAGWCVRTVTGKVDVIGKHHLSMHEAYEVAARQIDIAMHTPNRENCP